MNGDEPGVSSPGSLITARRASSTMHRRAPLHFRCVRTQSRRVTRRVAFDKPDCGNASAVRFRSGARLDSSQVGGRRGIPGGPVGGVLGGGGVIGIIVTVALLLMNGGGGGHGFAVGGDSRNLAADCQTGADANQRQDCRIVGVVNSVQAYWSQTLNGYHRAPTELYTQATQ